MPQRLFVYGTLAPDQPNQHVLFRIGGKWVPASVRGRLQEAGRGAEISPHLVLDRCTEAADGLVAVALDTGHSSLPVARVERLDARTLEVRVVRRTLPARSAPLTAHPETMKRFMKRLSRSKGLG